MFPGSVEPRAKMNVTGLQSPSSSSLDVLPPPPPDPSPLPPPKPLPSSPKPEPPKPPSVKVPMVVSAADELPVVDDEPEEAVLVGALELPPPNEGKSKPPKPESLLSSEDPKPPS